MDGEIWNLFPVNGLDRSLHLPVLIGLVIVSFFRETLGWTFAGLVVPGYLASVTVAAPATAGVVVAESIPAYWLALTVGKWLPRTGAWSTFFGRERFLLLIVTSLLARLFMEALVIPQLVSRYPTEHSRELYSLGLVLVPLLANSYWNVGLRRSAPRILSASLLTWVIVDQVLLEYTNFSVARFQMANESVSLAFLETPHAHIILLSGAVLGAVNNVRYGWDYNGILVPALLAVAWYQPTKLISTFAEALIVYGACLVVTRLPPLSRMLIVGSRRLVVAFLVGFAIKLGIGYAVNHFAPRLQMIDYFGFGYLLPTLLATKMWNTGRVAVTTMATVQVSLLAFVVGNGISFGLNWITAPKGDDRLEMAEFGGRLQTHGLAMQLMLLDSAPRPEPPDLAAGKLSPAQHVLRIVSQLRVGPPAETVLQKAQAAGLWMSNPNEERWRTIGPLASDANRDTITPRLALGPRTLDAKTLLLVETRTPGDPIVATAVNIAKALDARAIVLSSRKHLVRSHDEAFARKIYDLLDLESVIHLRSTHSPGKLSVVGRLPPPIDIKRLSTKLGTPPVVDFRSSSDESGVLVNQPRLTLNTAVAEKVAADLLTAPPIARWARPASHVIRERMVPLTEVQPDRFVRRSIEELRLFGDTVGRSPLSRFGNHSPSRYDRALAGVFDYRIAQAGPAGEDWVLFEPAGKDRVGNPTWVVRKRTKPERRSVMVEVAAPRWEIGTTTLGLALHSALDTQGFLLAGAMPTAAPDGSADVRHQSGIRSFYQRIHEIWLDDRRQALAIHGISRSHPANEKFYVTLRTNRSTLDGVPRWTRPFLASVTQNGLALEVVDGRLATNAFEGVTDPQMSYARQFGAGDMMMLWASADVRSRLILASRDTSVTRRLERLEMSTTDVDPRSPQFRQLLDSKSPSCPTSQLLRHLRIYLLQQNPYELEAALTLKDSCQLFVVRDPPTKLLWLVIPGQMDISTLHDANLDARAGAPVKGDHENQGNDGLMIPLRGRPSWNVTAPRPGVEFDAALSLGLNALLLPEGR